MKTRVMVLAGLAVLLLPAATLRQTYGDWVARDGRIQTSYAALSLGVMCRAPVEATVFLSSDRHMLKLASGTPVSVSITLDDAEPVVTDWVVQRQPRLTLIHAPDAMNAVLIPQLRDGKQVVVEVTDSAGSSVAKRRVRLSGFGPALRTVSCARGIYY